MITLNLLTERAHIVLITQYKSIKYSYWYIMHALSVQFTYMTIIILIVYRFWIIYIKKKKKKSTLNFSMYLVHFIAHANIFLFFFVL